MRALYSLVLRTGPLRSGLLPSVLLSLCAVAAGCGGGGGDDDAGAPPCMTDLDCDDGHECTLDSCGVDNACRHDAINERCDMGLTCEVGRGCVAMASCANDSDCDDMHACTLDRCGVGGICTHTALNERCTTAGEICDLDMGCITPAGCSSSAECDDSVPCTMDSCNAARMCVNTPLHELCDTAAGERCNATRGCFTPITCGTDADCADQGTFCEGAWRCDPEFGCEAPAAPRICDDSDDCTIDACDTGMDRCTFTCDRSRPECECPTDPPTCAGTFAVTGSSTSYMCAGGRSRVDFSTVTMSNDGGLLSVVLAADSFRGSPLTDIVDPVCPNFEATKVITGGCEEHYTIAGTFTDADNFMGTFDITYVPTDGLSCSLGLCVNQNIAITGTRR